jgi:hypothetical protein
MQNEKDILLTRRQFLQAACAGTAGAVFSPLFLSGCTQQSAQDIIEAVILAITKLPALINDYREANGLARIPLSSKLTAVAIAHVIDLNTYQPHLACGESGNLHSWSNHGSWTDTPGDGGWKGCCYLPDPSHTQCMWDKPKEIANYSSNGYEIAAAGVTGPADALNSWKTSTLHNDVILNRGTWTTFQWQALGAMYGANYACAWFGTTPD